MRDWEYVFLYNILIILVYLIGNLNHLRKQW
jgi:hypothetical protein